MNALYLLYPGMGMRGIRGIARMDAATLIANPPHTVATVVLRGYQDTVQR
jgi:hypothetical protein